MSQTELAGAELSASYVSLIESGKRTPTEPVLALLATRLETTVDFLRDGVDAQTREEHTLRLRYAELALQNGEAAEALTQFGRLREEVQPGTATHEETLWGTARALEAQGRLEEAIGAYDGIRERAELAPDRAGRWADSVVALCRCSLEAGDLARAVDLGETAMRHIAELGLEPSELQAQIVSTLVGAYHQRGDLVRAQALADQLVHAVEEQPSHGARGAAYWNASLIAEARGRMGEALTLAEKALALYSEGESRRSLARLRVAYAWLLLREPEPRLERSRELLERARDDLLDSGTSVDLAYCDTELARVHLLAGDPAGAVACAQAVLDRIGVDRLESGRALLVIGQALCLQGDLEAGRRTVMEASRALQQAGSSREAAAAWREVGDVFSGLGEQQGALEAYQRALGLLGVSRAPVPSGALIEARRA
jgi:tetratricopeptide (TPR) repeat protein